MHTTYRSFSESFDEEEMLRAAENFFAAPVPQTDYCRKNSCRVPVGQTKTYGIIVEGPDGTELCKFCDLTFDENKITDLASRLNNEGVELAHIEEIIDDFLCV